ncbi:hypothetical protein I3843_13G133400 [Carya illinoinensis]|nr:hypothetical protein I3843_13G133400 [Carya illinoinensis]
MMRVVTTIRYGRDFSAYKFITTWAHATQIVVIVHTSNASHHALHGKEKNGRSERELAFLQVEEVGTVVGGTDRRKRIINEENRRDDDVWMITMLLVFFLTHFFLFGGGWVRDIDFWVLLSLTLQLPLQVSNLFH